MKVIIYLDWAATAKPNPDLMEKVSEVSIQYYGNPSSLHAAGRDSEKLLVESRTTLAKSLACTKNEIIFTSGATESNNMLILAMLRKLHLGKSTADRPKVIISGIEHASVYEPANTLRQFGFEVTVIKADFSGRIRPEIIAEELDDNTILVSLIYVNNETGAVQSVSDVVKYVRDFSVAKGKHIIVHTDAVQAFGKIPFEPVLMGIDAASISAHKIGGPKGVGALFLQRDTNIEFLYTGGGQEKKRRPGTENVPGIYGLALAAEKCKQTLDQSYAKASTLMNYLIEELVSIEGVHIIPQSRLESPSADFSPYILNVAFPPIPGEVLVRVLEDEGILVSTGSACSSRSQKRTRVLENMGVPPETAQCAIRISIGRETTAEDIDRLIDVLKKRVTQLLSIAR